MSGGLSLRIGGDAGQGVESSGAGLDYPTTAGPECTTCVGKLLEGEMGQEEGEALEEDELEERSVLSGIGHP